MDLDKAWMDNDFASDIFEMMLEQESLPKYSKVSHVRRRKIITWMIRMSEGIICGSQKYAFDHRTLHLAVYIFDNYLHTHNPIGDVIYLVAAAAMIVAAKFEENGQFTTIAIRAIKSMLPNVTMSAIQRMELSLLCAANWRLLVPTTATFIPHFIAASNGLGSTGNSNFDYNTTALNGGYLYLPELYFKSGERRKPRFWRCEFFDRLKIEGVLLLLRDRLARTERVSHESNAIVLAIAYHLSRENVNYLCRMSRSFSGTAYWLYKPSEIAASAVAAARFCINAAPTWPSTMVSLTKYSVSDLYYCVHLLLHDFDCERRQKSSYFPELINRTDFATSWLLATKTIVSPSNPNIQPVSASSPRVEQATFQPVHAKATIPPVSYSSLVPASESLPFGQRLQAMTMAGCIPAMLVFMTLPTGQAFPVLLPSPPFWNGTDGLGLLAEVASSASRVVGDENGCAKKAKMQHEHECSKSREMSL